MRKNKIENFIGKQFGDLIVVGPGEKNGWLFKCICGKEISCVPNRVISGHIKSCGCRKKRKTTTHGVARSEYYHGWWSMMQRCYNPEHHNYSRYGGRGIDVCKDWHDPAVFCSWATSVNGEARNGLSLDRIDNDKGYSPENCRWATAAEQSDNRRNTVMVDFHGERVSLAKLSREKGMNPTVVSCRVFQLGWDIETALNTPVFFTVKNSYKVQNKTHSANHNRIVDINGEKRSITQWCEYYGTSRNAAYKRIARGWNPVDAVKTQNKK